MKRLLRALVLVSVVMAAMSGCQHDPAASLDRWMLERRSATYRVPDAADREALSGAFAGSLAGRPASGWHALAYESTTAGGHVAVRETDPAHRGWGAYAFRTAEARPLLVQAPHSESDRHSGEIAYALYRETRARALAVNSAHRSLPQADQASADGPFTVLTREALRERADSVVLQVHGFGADTAARYGLSASTLVASNGTRVPDAALREVAACLREAGFDARLFPEEAPYPGGTRNAVGQAVREVPAARFMHFEMGADLRQELLTRPERVEAFAACL
ncbi:hypothetical protein ACFFGH_08875 [Lysobacter korlensis]|uniref:Lipoprotein n=1 Tax=Lysobacter korlensis TaxID=553636 RepID=A0ABV6RNI8_9GAMM